MRVAGIGRNRQVHFVWLSLALLFVEVVLPESITSTGGYSRESTGTIKTPGHPSNYSRNLNRIWVLEAPSAHGVRIEIGPVNGEKNESDACISTARTPAMICSACVDYLEIRDGNSSGKLLFLMCLTTEIITLQSTNRWMWIRFYSNWETEASGFTAKWTHFARININDLELNPRPMCRGNEIRCPNTECVTQSWRCDGFNDCGYDGDGSDEDWWCSTTPISASLKYAYGVSIGVLVFFLLILLVAWLDGRFAAAGRCGRGPKSCLGLDNLRRGPRTRRLPSYGGQTPAMLLLTGQHEKFEELAAKEWEKRNDAYKRRASTIDLLAIDDPPSTPEPQNPAAVAVETTPTKPAAVQRKGQQKFQHLHSELDQGIQEPIPSNVKRQERSRPWAQADKKIESITMSQEKQIKDK